MADTTTRRGRPTAVDSRQKQENVLTVARELFGEIGYRAVTMRDVADRAQVSTRTLYNRYADKVSLFAACIDFHSGVFPQLVPEAGQDPETILARHGGEIVRALSEGTSLRLGMLIYREGGDAPELVRAADANQHRYLVEPLAEYLRALGLEKGGSFDMARLFISMTISEWQRSVVFGHPMPSEDETACHARNVAAIFLHGAANAD